jgi:hypothetical protein
MAARRSSTVYLWELAWILPSIALPVSMLTALAVTALGAGITVVGDRGRIDSTKVAGWINWFGRLPWSDPSLAAQVLARTRCVPCRTCSRSGRRSCRWSGSAEPSCS